MLYAHRHLGFLGERRRNSRCVCACMHTHMNCSAFFLEKEVARKPATLDVYVYVSLCHIHSCICTHTHIHAYTPELLAYLVETLVLIQQAPASVCHAIWREANHLNVTTASDKQRVDGAHNDCEVGGCAGVVLSQECVDDV